MQKDGPDSGIELTTVLLWGNKANHRAAPFFFFFTSIVTLHV